MAQNVEFPGFQGKTLDLRLLSLGTNTIVHTAAELTAYGNDPTWFKAADVPDALNGIHRVSVIENGTSSVKYGGFVKLTGVAGATHYAETSYASLNVWSAASRTLTQTAAEIAAALDGETIIWTRGINNTVTLDDLGDLTSFDAIYFTVKESPEQPDEDAIIQLKLTSGGDSLVRLMAAAPTGGEDGSLVIDDAVLGVATFSLNPAASTKLTSRSGYWDVKVIAGTIPRLAKSGKYDPRLDITRAVA